MEYIQGHTGFYTLFSTTMEHRNYYVSSDFSDNFTDFFTKLI